MVVLFPLQDLAPKGMERLVVELFGADRMRDAYVTVDPPPPSTRC